MNKTRTANLWDIIRSEKFAFGYYGYQRDANEHLNPKKDVITVDGETREYRV